MGDKHNLTVILALPSQIFEYLCETFGRRALGYLESASIKDNKEEKKGFFLRKRLTIIGLLKGLWSMGTRLRHSRQSWVLNKKTGYATLCQHVTKDVTFE